MSDFDQDARRDALYSTDAAPALGLSKYQTPAQLWAQKRGLSEPADLSEVFEVQAGNTFQPLIARMHADATGDALKSLSELEVRAEVRGVPIGSHFDYYNVTTDHLHEVKFFAPHRQREFGPPGSDSVPMDVLVQCLHEMVAWNESKPPYGRAEGVEVNVMFGNTARIVFVVPWDAEAVEKLLQREAEFWALVQTGSPPAPQSPEDARRIWHKSDGSEVQATRDVALACQALAGIKRQIETLDAQSDALKTAIQGYMKEASVLVGPDGAKLATWASANAPKRVDVKALRDNFPDIAAQVTVVGESSRRFLLK